MLEDIHPEDKDYIIKHHGEYRTMASEKYNYLIEFVGPIEPGTSKGIYIGFRMWYQLVPMYKWKLIRTWHPKYCKRI